MRRSELWVVLVRLAIAGGKTRFWSDGAYYDADAGRVYDPRVVGDVTWTRSVSCILWDTAPADNGIGVIELANDDGALDDLVTGDQSGGVVTVSLVASGAPISSERLVATVDVARIEARGERTVRVVTESVLARLATPFGVAYASDDAYPPPPALVGKPRPWALGRPLSCPVPLIDPVDQQFDVHENGDWSVARVLDSGIELTSGSGYEVSSTPGVFGIELQAMPVGRVVADVDVGGVLEVAECVAMVCDRAVGAGILIDVELDSVAALGAACPWPASLWIDTGTEYLDVLQQLLDSVAGWVAPTAAGALMFGVLHLPDPETEPALVIDELSLAGDIEIAPDLAPGLSTTVCGARNYYAYQPDELADGVSEDERTALTADYRVRRTPSVPMSVEIRTRAVSPLRAADVDVAVRSRGRVAATTGLGTALYQPKDVQAMANRLASLYPEGSVSRFVRMPVHMLEGAEDVVPGWTTVLLRHSRFGMGDVLGLVTRVEGRVGASQVVITARFVIAQEDE